ncbi:MAG: hypothetical protein IJX03_02885 [Clostridia bacterium]|nr:hypothetical protein [Clostridia bacterium]
MKKGLLKILGLTLALVMCFSAFGCNNTASAEASSFVSVDINPSIELTLDGNDKVLSVRGTDEDGQVLLYGETSLVGLDVEAAIEKITFLAVELGYLSEDNKVVNTSVSAKTKAIADKVRDKVNAKITATVGDFNVTIDEEQAYSLKRQFEQFKADYSEYADSITIEQFKLALSASETGEVTLEAAIEMDAKELIKIISDAHKALKDYATEEYLKAKHKAEADFNNNISGIVDGIYGNKDFGLHLIPGLDVGKYGDVMGSVRQLEGIVKSFKFEKVINYELTTNEVDALVTALGLSDSIPLQNADGKVTLGSVYGYLDKTLKNLPETDAETVKTNIEDVIAGIEANAKTYVEQAINAHKAQIETLLGNVQIQGVDLTDGASEEEVKLIIDHFKAQAQTLLETIEAHIPKEIRHLVEQAKNFKDKADYQEHHGKMEDAINAAKETAQQKLQDLKNARRPAPVN